LKRRWMFFQLLALSLLFAAFSSVTAQTPRTPEEIQATLSRAETLYRQARFKESIQLLTPLDRLLQGRPDHVRVKLQLALAHVGLNETSAARTFFQELCSLDPDYELDALQFAPKVVTLFNEARGKEIEARCSAACREANRLLNAGNSQALLTWLRTAPQTCPCVETVAETAAALFYKQGLEAYKQDNFGTAIQRLQIALNFDSQHEMAAQYLDLAQNKLQQTVDRLVLEWRGRFASEQFSQAASIYRQLLSPSLAGKATDALEGIRTEYRKRVSSIAEAWQQDCTANPRALQQATDLLPDASIARDILDQIKPCSTPVPTPVQGEPCQQVSGSSAMLRVKTRVDPDIPRSSLPPGGVNIFVKMKIDTSGNVTVSEVQGSTSSHNEALKAAVEKWKFSPAIAGGRSYCVETELPFTLIR
jgi:tetratricopeptide (TPR) repeat protein